MKITYLNGLRFNRAIKAACICVTNQQKILNDINVFPVPDSDTGTNMAPTMNFIAENVDTNNETSIEKASELIAESALNGPRGSSGVRQLGSASGRTSCRRLGC